MSAIDEARASLTVVREHPALILAELAWRWAFAVGAIGIMLTYSPAVRDALSLSAADQGALLSAGPMQMIMMGSAILINAMPLLIAILVSAVPKIALVWWLCATIGRGQLLHRMMHFTSQPAPRKDWRYWVAMLEVHGLRIITLLILLSAWLGGARLSALVMGNPDAPNIVAMFVIFLLALAVGALLWALAHFVASNAALFVAAGETRGFHAVARAFRFSVEKMSSLWAAAAINAAWRTGFATVITILGLLLIPAARIVPAALIITLAAVLSVIYCAASDVLLLARTLAYLRIAFAAPSAQLQENSHQTALYSATSDLRK